MRRKLVKNILNKVYKPFVADYLKKVRLYRWQDINLIIQAGVFHPGIFHSTKVLLSYLNTENLNNKSFLELGAGSGLISIFAAKKGANVTATDISRTAIDGLKQNSVNNDVKIKVIQSNIFEKIPENVFEYICINPPYYKGIPKNDASYAWYAGENYEYFENLFGNLHLFSNIESKIIMILSEDSEIEIVKYIAIKYNFNLMEKFRKRIWFEDQIVFEIFCK